MLSLPGLKKKKIQIDYYIFYQRYNFEDSLFNIKKLKQFAETLLREPAVFAVIYISVADAAKNTQTAGAEPILLKKLLNYQNIFSNKNTGKLPPNRLRNYIIKLNKNNPPYESLYNFSAIKLAVLKIYLNNALIKNQI